MILLKDLQDKEIWEDFLIKNSPQSFFQSWNWGEVSKKEGNEIERIGIYSGKQILGIFQLASVEAKRGTFLHLRHGPILKSWSKETFKEVMVYLEKLASEKKAAFIRISPLIPETKEHRELLTSFGFRDAPIHAMDGEYIWLLDIVPEEQELLSNMRKTTRYLIKKAQTIGVEVKKTDNIDDFFSLYHITAKRHGFMEHKGIKEEFEIFSKEKKAILLTGIYEGKTIAAAIIVFYGNQAIYRHGASIPSDIPAAYLIQWEAIKEARNRGLTLYNFWGIAPEEKINHPWKGITLFKKGFGGRVVSYLHTQDKILSPKYITTFTLESFMRIKKGY